MADFGLAKKFFKTYA